MNILIWIITGIIAGWLAGMFVRGGGFGVIGDLIIGLIGGLLGGWLFGLMGVSASSWIGQVLVAAAGGVVLVLILRMLRRA
ncbi:MAG: GlsB/YeaQ/YmgE family stress response membrane protein [Anaerolineales bacterium]|jgi:uncharacterized membrane protein YeaQ/YmgE (transglycosylase-associated protein family)